MASQTTKPVQGLTPEEALQHEAEKALADAIVAKHPNFVELVQEPGFDDFVIARGAQAVVDAGSADEINALLDDYVATMAVAASAADASTDGQPVGATEFGEVDNPREVRALRALLSGPVRRERLDRAAGVSNSPDLVMNLRRDVGLEIPCERVSSIDRDGRSIKVGVYSLSPADRPKVIAWLDETSNNAQEHVTEGSKPEVFEGAVLTDEMRANPFIAACL